ncbi:MAG: signal peptidase II [Bacilli bacterium]|nr:signal peptidase II [Bacilli bacterium]
MKKIFYISSALVLIDQILKFIVIKNFSLNLSYEIIHNFFNLTYVKNTGAAFSILTNSTLLLIIISLASLFLIYKYLLKDKQFKKYETIVYSMLIGGLVGNLIDRIFHGYVIDYLEFIIFKYHFPIFNFADICIVLSIIVLFFILGSEKDAKN